VGDAVGETRALAQQALAVLPAPLRACATGFTFDAEEFYETNYDEERSRGFSQCSI
jgi:hypothetical protein